MIYYRALVEFTVEDGTEYKPGDYLGYEVSQEELQQLLQDEKVEVVDAGP